MSVIGSIQIRPAPPKVATREASVQFMAAPWPRHERRLNGSGFFLRGGAACFSSCTAMTERDDTARTIWRRVAHDPAPSALTISGLSTLSMLSGVIGPTSL